MKISILWKMTEIPVFVITVKKKQGVHEKEFETDFCV